MDSPADGGDVGDWDVPDDVLAMPGYEILQSAQHLGRVLGILLGNAAELQRYFDALNAPTDPSRLLPLWDAENRDAFDAHLNEAERLLFNFLAACYSRVEFYRTLVNKGLIVGELRTRVRPASRRARLDAAAPLAVCAAPADAASRPTGLVRHAHHGARHIASISVPFRLLVRMSSLKVELRGTGIRVRAIHVPLQVAQHGLRRCHTVPYGHAR